MIGWRKVGFLRQGQTRTYDYTLILPLPLADWDVWDYWEREHIESVRTTLGPGDTLIEVGTEHGWMSCVFAHVVGPEAMVLIEPTAEFWPNIRQTWERNHPRRPPRATWRGLFGATNNGAVFGDGWPVETDGPISPARSYTYLHEHPETPTARLDDFVTATGIIPKGITVDVEGAEHEVMKGAERTLTDHRPFVWLSVHPEMMVRDYATSPEALDRFMRSCGYGPPTLLAVDHEEHWLWSPA